jgi:hypothetical protein
MWGGSFKEPSRYRACRVVSRWLFRSTTAASVLLRTADATRTLI